jgi:hypothetical protein
MRLLHESVSPKGRRGEASGRRSGSGPALQGSARTGYL